MRFRARASNQHGVHSPFVYDYVTKCLYQKTKGKLPVTEEVLLKSISYFNVKNIGLVNNSDILKQRIKAIDKDISFQHVPFDIIYADEQSQFFKKVAKEQVHNDSMLLISGIHNTPEHHQNWKKLRSLEQARVTIDLFYCGIVFLRRQQAKQHFRIRI
ncbi:hypothetical protein [Maribacter sp. 2210JD10-5]|uniref:hypothetical protein n=1 Tax=Maribacter sp. 2210JD10-5 TaxID=3386272 RepID=UPI0039BC91CC